MRRPWIAKLSGAPGLRCGDALKLIAVEHQTGSPSTRRPSFRRRPNRRTVDERGRRSRRLAVCPSAREICRELESLGWVVISSGLLDARARLSALDDDAQFMKGGWVKPQPPVGSTQRRGWWTFPARAREPSPADLRLARAARATTATRRGGGLAARSHRSRRILLDRNFAGINVRASPGIWTTPPQSTVN